MIRSGASLVRLGDIAQEVTRRAGHGHDFPVCSVTKHAGFVPSLEYFKKQVFSRRTANYKLVARGEFAYATIHLDEGSLGFLSQVDTAAISPMYTVFRVDPSRVYGPYLYAILKAPQAIAQYSVLGQGSVHRRKAISFERLGDMRVPLPTLPEQRRIADILDKVDAVRRKRKEAIALTEELLRSAFLEMFGDPLTNPKRWKPATVEELCERIVDCPHTTPRYDEPVRSFACVRTSDLQGGFLEWSTTKYVGPKEYVERTARARPVAGDVLYSREGGRLGIAALVPDGVSLCLGQRMMLLRASSTGVTPEFLWGLMNAPGTYRQAMREVGGSASPHVNVGAVREFKVFKSPFSEQCKFSSVYARAMFMRGKAMASSAAADELFSSLVYHAFCGELARRVGSKATQLKMFADVGAE